MLSLFRCDRILVGLVGALAFVCVTGASLSGHALHRGAAARRGDPNAAMLRATEPAQQSAEHRWSTIVALGERLGTQIDVDSQKLTTGDPLKRRLLDAQLHLYYAQIDRLTLGDPAAADKQLERAHSDLETAVEQLPRSVQLQLQPLDRKLQALLGGFAITDGSPIEAARLRYDLASADLHELETAL